MCKDISDGLLFFDAVDANADLYPPQLLAIIMLSKAMVNEGLQFDWDHTRYQREIADAPR